MCTNRISTFINTIQKYIRIVKYSEFNSAFGTKDILPIEVVQSIVFCKRTECRQMLKVDQGDKVGRLEKKRKLKIL